jgi:hypothetical protein
MTIVDRQGRFFGLVSVIDLIVFSVLVSVVAAGSRLALSRALAGQLTAVVVVVGLLGLVVASKWYHDVQWETVANMAREARPSLPSRPSLETLRNWVTADPDSGVVVVDLRETLTVGPIIIALDWVTALVAN